MELTNGIYKLEKLQLVIVRELIQLFFWDLCNISVNLIILALTL